MANIGSAFLGDLQAKRIRQLSSPTGSSAPTSPPSSPPATAIQNNNRMSVIQPLSPPQLPEHSEMPSGTFETAVESSLNKTTIDPALALELRVRWLEVLVLGLSGSNPPNESTKGERKTNNIDDRVRKSRSGFNSLQGKAAEKQEGKGNEKKGRGTAATLVRLTEEVKKRLDTIVETNEALRKFMGTYDQHSQYLTPQFALSGIIDAPLPLTPTSDTTDGTKSIGSSLLPVYENMSPQELEAFLAELEPDVRAADRDMREIESLVAKGVTGAGQLGDYEALKPRLKTLIKEHEDDLQLASDLEKRVAKLVERHVTRVDSLSELFVAWDDTLLEAENRTIKLEKDARERQRLGLEP